MALVLIVALLAALTLAPRRAAADDLSDGEIAAIVVGSIAGYIALIAIATAAVYGWGRRKPPQTLPMDLMKPRPAVTDGFRLASDCPPRDGRVQLLCW